METEAISTVRSALSLDTCYAPSYHILTISGSWAEERRPEARGVLSDYLPKTGHPQGNEPTNLRYHNHHNLKGNHPSPSYLEISRQYLAATATNGWVVGMAIHFVGYLEILPYGLVWDIRTDGERWRQGPE